MNELKAEHVSDDVRAMNPDLFDKRKRPVSAIVSPPNTAEAQFETLIITIPQHECPSWNDLYVQKHWSNRREVVKAIHKIVGLYAPSLDEPIAVPVHVIITVYRRRLIDADNVPAKFYIDGLCRAGVLNDDTKQYVNAVTTRCEQGEPEVKILLCKL